MGEGVAMDSGRVEVRVGFRGASVRMFVDPADHIGRGIAASLAFYEEELLADLLWLVGAGDLVLDVGANIGNHTLFFAGIAGCRVEAFEPNPAALALLEANIGANEASQRIRMHRCAVGAVEARVALHESPAGNLGATRFVSRDDGEFPMVALDSLSFPSRVALVKVDAEGMDFDVLRGAERLIARDRPVLVVECQTPAEFATVSDWLHARGYVATGCYNATDTYVFLPAGDAEELARVTRFAMRQVVRAQGDLRALRKSVRRFGKEVAPLTAAALPAAVDRIDAAQAELVRRIEELERAGQARKPQGGDSMNGDGA